MWAKDKKVSNFQDNLNSIDFCVFTIFINLLVFVYLIKS